MPFGNRADRLHNLGKLRSKAKSNNKIAQLALDFRELFDPKAVKALTPDKSVACHNAACLYIKVLKGGKDLVGSVAHAVEHHRLI